MKRFLPAIRLKERRQKPANDVQLRYLSQSARLEETVGPRLIRLTAILTSISILAFIFWSSVTNINEIARTPGEVVPAGYEQSVQHLYGGVIKTIEANDGQLVEKGQTLLTIDGSGVKEDLARTKRKQWALQVQAKRLRAFLNNRQPDFSGMGDGGDPRIKEQLDAFRTMVEARTRQVEILQDQLEQKQKDITIYRARLETARKSLRTGEELLRRRGNLLESDNISYVRFAQTEQQVNEQRGRVDVLERQLSQSDAAAQEYRKRLSSVGATHRDDAYRELHGVESELTQNEEIIAKLEQRVKGLTIRSPARGIVKGLKENVNTVGGVIEAGQTVAKILPVDDDLIVKIKIEPRHIGHVSTGLPVQLKISAYDFARYGSVPGTLNFISATTFSNDDGTRYYAGDVKLSRRHVDPKGTKLPIRPGMTVMAEIITGEKTILEYLLKPVQVSVSQALSEK